MKNKLVSLILVVVMALTIIPSVTFAGVYDPSVDDIFDTIPTTVTTVTTTNTTTTTTTQKADEPEVPASSSTSATSSTEATSTNTTVITSVTTPIDPTNPDVTNQSHTHVYLARITKEATCLESGVKTFSCSKCDAFYTVDIPMLDHKTQVEVVESTYFQNGAKIKSCMFCQTEISIKVTNKKVLSKTTFSLKKDRRKFKINYKKVSGAIGFQVRYKLSGKWKTKTFNTKKSVTRTIKNLKKGKYSVQIRVFRKLNGAKVYSRWTASKKVNVMK